MPTITIPVEDAIFVLCTLLGGSLLLVTVLVDDILGGLLDALHVGVDIGGVSLMPLLLGFVSMFGVGGLFATQLLGVHGGQAALVGTGFGAVGFGVVYTMFSVFRRAEGSAPFELVDLVGRSASVAVAIPAGRFGSVYVHAEGQTHEFTATAPVDLPTGSAVRVMGVHGNGLIVAPETAPAGEGGTVRA
jgi:membrane protein implicated in regulation of membrane protease activity